MAHDALICRKPFVSYIHQFLKLPFGGGGCLVELVLQSLDRFIQWGDALLQFLEGAADIFGAFILRKSVAGPAFLVVGFERDPFLAK